MIRYVVTDISNVARFLSLGCLGPRTIHDDKYRPDASVRYDGALVLFEDVQLAAQEAARLEGAVVIVELQGEFFASIPGRDGLVLTGSLIPASSISRLHFGDEATQREFRTLEYQNVDPKMLEQAVNPTIFKVTESDAAIEAKGEKSAQVTLEIEESSSVTRLELISADRIEGIDRSVGALAALLRPLRPSKALLRKVGNVVGAVLQQMEGSDAVVGDMVVTKDERALHEVTCGAMRATPHEDVGYDGILDALASHFPELVHQLTGVREMLAASRDVVPEEVSSLCLRALLLALLGRTPSTLRSLSPALLPDDPETEILALWYAGLREGGARRPVVHRLGAFESHLQVWMARQGSAGAPLEFPTVQFKPKVLGTVADGQFEYFLEDKSTRVGPIIREFPSPCDRLKTEARNRQRSAVGIAKALGVPIVTTIIFRKNVAFAMDDVGLRVDAPHDVAQDTDIELVCLALDGAAHDTLIQLADRFVSPLTEAP